MPGRPRRALVLILLGLAAVVAVGPGASAASLSAAAPVGPCEQARTLSAAGYPQRAAALIATVRKTPAAANDCAAEWSDAAVRSALATALLTWSQADPRSDLAPGTCTGAAITGATRDALSAEALAQAEACDREVPGLAAAKSPPSLGARISTSWATFVTTNLTPWTSALVGVLGWAALGLVLARLFTLILGLVRTGPVRRASSPIIRGAGLAGIAAGAILGVLSRTAHAVPHLGIGAAVAVTAVSAAGLAQYWRAGPRLQIVAASSEGVTADEITAAIRRMGMDQPRGLEIPLGPDTDFIEAIGLSKFSDNVVVKALTIVAELVRPPMPWRLIIESNSADVLSAELLRNRRSVAGPEHYSRADLFRSLEGVDPPKDAPALSIAPFPAALAVVTMAGIQDSPGSPGLSGATDARSVAFQYLGAQLQRTDPRRSGLFALAVARDRDNWSALLSDWTQTYRYSADAAELETFRRLTAQLAPATGPGSTTAPGSSELRLRASYSRLAAGINRNAILAAEGRAGEDLADEATHLARSFGVTGYVAPDPPLAGRTRTFAERQQPAVLALISSVEGVTSPVARGAVTPGRVGPGAAYSWACSWATVRPVDPAAAVEFLKRADTFPELALWRTQDPQLARLRRTRTYVTAFGVADLFEIAPFARRARVLKGAGLTSTDTIAAAETADLAALGIRGAEARWLRELARLRSSLPASLTPWAGELLGTIAANGYPASATPLQQLADLLPEPKGTCHDVVAAVALRAAVTAWWERGRATPHA